MTIIYTGPNFPLKFKNVLLSKMLTTFSIFFTYFNVFSLFGHILYIWANASKISNRQLSNGIMITKFSICTNCRAQFFCRVTNKFHKDCVVCVFITEKWRDQKWFIAYLKHFNYNFLRIMISSFINYDKKFQILPIFTFV